MNNKNHPNSKHTTTFNLSKSSWNILQMFPFLFLLFCMNYELFDFIQLLFMKHVVITPHFSRQNTQNRNNEREKLPQKKPKTSFVILFMNIFLICFFLCESSMVLFFVRPLITISYHEMIYFNQMCQFCVRWRDWNRLPKQKKDFLKNSIIWLFSWWRTKNAIVIDHLIIMKIYLPFFVSQV